MSARPPHRPEPGAALERQRAHWEKTLGEQPEKFGSQPSVPARAAAATFAATGARSVLELGAGQGRDTVLFAERGFEVDALDYAMSGVDSIRAKAQEAGLGAKVRAAQHDVRLPLPFADGTFDACYSHMLFCMALTEAELATLSAEIRRVLRPGGLSVYTVRNTSDPDYAKGAHHGAGLYELGGYVVHFFSRETVERLATGYELVELEEFEEGPLPRRLFRVTLRRR